MANIGLIILVITVPLKISLIPKSKCVATVRKDSDITSLPMPVKPVHYLESLTERVETMVHVWRIVLPLKIVNSGYLKTTLVRTVPDISIKEITSILLMLNAIHVQVVNMLRNLT